MEQQKIIDMIKQYKELLDAGAITQKEYDAKKAELLSSSAKSFEPSDGTECTDEPEPEESAEEQNIVNLYREDKIATDKIYNSYRYAKPLAEAVISLGFALLLALGRYSAWAIICLIVAVIAIIIGFRRKSEVEKKTRRRINSEKVKNDIVKALRYKFSSTAICIIYAVLALFVLAVTLSSCADRTETAVKESNITTKTTTTTTTQVTTQPTTKATIPPDEYKNSCQEATYEQLSRNDDLAFLRVKVKGKVAQVIPDGNDIHMRVSITNDGYFWDDDVYVVYTYHDGEDRILEDDIVAVYGIFAGQTSYTSTLGSKITLPLIYAEYVDMIK